MDMLAVFIAVNGLIVLLFSSVVGLVLARSLHQGATSEHWHLLHASGTSRGIMLLALATTIQFARLPVTHLYWASGLIIFFVWTSVLAMAVRAFTGEKGFHAGGPPANKGVFYLYASGAIALSVGLVWLIVGLFLAFA